MILFQSCKDVSCVRFGRELCSCMRMRKVKTAATKAARHMQVHVCEGTESRTTSKQSSPMRKHLRSKLETSMQVESFLFQISGRFVHTLPVTANIA
jgi:hypothetical protein